MGCINAAQFVFKKGTLDGAGVHKAPGQNFQLFEILRVSTTIGPSCSVCVAVGGGTVVVGSLVYRPGFLFISVGLSLQSVVRLSYYDCHSEASVSASGAHSVSSVCLRTDLGTSGPVLREFAEVRIVSIFSSHDVLFGWSTGFLRTLPAFIRYNNLGFWFSGYKNFVLVPGSAFLWVFCFGWRGEPSSKSARLRFPMKSTDRVVRELNWLGQFCRFSWNPPRTVRCLRCLVFGIEHFNKQML